MLPKSINNYCLGVPAGEGASFPRHGARSLVSRRSYIRPLPDWIRGNGLSVSVVLVTLVPFSWV